MPAPGQQHASIVNPFEEPKQRISEYTAQEIATLQSRLEKQLGPEYISSRSGPGGQKVHYVAAEKCIALANEVFGFNGWSSSIQNIQMDFVDEHPQTLKISLGLSVIVRVTLRDGTYHEDIGYGHIENCKGKAAAFEKAKKEGTTDALKRALRSFGNVLGNCIYDKTYLAKVTKMKVEPAKFDESGLHRHQDFVKKEAQDAADAAEAAKKANAETQALESFDDIFAEFDDVDFAADDDEIQPDEVALTSTVQSNSDEKTQPQATVAAAGMQPPSRPLGRSVSGGSTYNRGPQTPNQQQNPRPNQYSGSNYNAAQNQVNQTGQRSGQQYNQNKPQQHHSINSNFNNMHSNHTNSSSTTASTSGQSSHTPQQAQNASGPAAATGQGAPPGSQATGFFSARAVKEIPEDALATGASLAPLAGQVFNPRAESPSIRKTPGIDHTKSKPLARNGQHVAPAATQEKATGGPGAPPTAGGLVSSRPGAHQQPQQQQQRPMAGNVVNPQFNATRQIGAPGGPGSPLANRGQYRPPTMLNKRPAEGGRAPLAEVSTNANAGGGVAPGISGPDAKRLKMG